jgi:hypothetical protein
MLRFCFGYLLMILFLIARFFPAAFGQGCSDAGFCTMGAMKPDQHFSKRIDFRLRSVKIEQYFGVSQFDNVIQSVTIDLNVGLSPKSTVQFKLPYMKSAHAGWFLEGIGDASLSFTRNIFSSEKFQINATIGSKIPSGSSNGKIKSGQTLPMYYQISLGTYDIVLGGSFISEKWLFAAGWQKALNANGSEFSYELWEGHRRKPEILKYPESYHLRRSGDVMFRAERNFRFSRFSCNAGVLLIHRFNEDRITDVKTGEEIRAKGSSGLASTFLLGAQYRLSVKSSLIATFGKKLTSREINPDGLSRARVYVFAYQYNF